MEVITNMEQVDKIVNDEKRAAFEIEQGMTVEEMRSLFFDENALIEPPYKVYQLNSKGHRYYYRYEDEQPVFYPSVTTILHETMPTSPFLMKWMCDKGYDEAERYKNERAYYGTFMHAQFEELLINRAYDLDLLKDKLKDYIEVNRLPDNFIFYADDLKKDILSFAKFVMDYQVKPLAVEIALVHPELNYAGMIDCPCTMLSKVGGEDRITAIVDFKSGRNGFYEDCELQLHMYKDMWNINFPNNPIDKVFNFSPKDWRKKPTYNLKNQTESPNAEKIPALLHIAGIEEKKRNNMFTSVSGTIDLNGDLSENIISLTLSELIKNKTQEKAPQGKELTSNERKDEKGINIYDGKDKPSETK